MKQNNAKRKSAKGMTLIEVIISILVFGVTGLIMVTCATTTCNFLRESTHVTNKTNAEGPVAIVQDPGALTNAEGQIIANKQAEAAANGETYEIPTDTNGDPLPLYTTAAVDVTVRLGSSTQTITAKRYTTASLGDLGGELNVTKFGGDLEFYVIDPTEPTT